MIPVGPFIEPQEAAQVDASAAFCFLPLWQAPPESPCIPDFLLVLPLGRRSARPTVCPWREPSGAQNALNLIVDAADSG